MDQQTILITGAGQRIGLAVVNHLRQCGYNIIMSYRTERASINRLVRSGVTCIKADFSSDEGINSFIGSVKSLGVPLRAIIHNASDWASEKNTSDIAGLLDDMMQVHVKAPYLINHGLSSQLLDSDVAMSDIIHMTDHVAQKGSNKHIAYAASKAALENLTLSFASKLSPYTKVNSIAPALILFNEEDDGEYKKKALAKSLMGITPGASEVVNAIACILSSRYMTGQTLRLDGGRHLR